MNEQIPILYYDYKTIDLDLLARISEGLRGFFKNCIVLPKEVDLTFMDKETLINELQNTIDMLQKEEEKENKKEEDNKNEW